MLLSPAAPLRPLTPRPAGEPALRYFRDTFPSLRAPLHSEGVADLLVDVTTQASKLQGAAPSGPATAFAEAYEASPLRAECDAQIEVSCCGDSLGRCMR